MNHQYRYVYFGTPEISAQVLQSLIEADMPPGLLICNPDSGTSLPPTKKIAQNNSIPVYQPERLDPQEMKEKIADSDFAVLFAYGKIVPQSVIELFLKGIIVVHPSLLPGLRGATPVPSFILSGEEKTGTTLFIMDEKVDHGPIIAQTALCEDLSRITTTELFDKLTELSAELLITTLPDFIKGRTIACIQDESFATYTKKFSSEDGFTDLIHEEPVIIDRKIRALNPEPGVWTVLNEPLPKTMSRITLPLHKRIKLLSSVREHDVFLVTQIQVEGKKVQASNIRLPPLP